MSQTILTSLEIVDRPEVADEPENETFVKLVLHNLESGQRVSFTMGMGDMIIMFTNTLEDLKALIEEEQGHSGLQLGPGVWAN